MEYGKERSQIDKKNDTRDAILKMRNAIEVYTHTLTHTNTGNKFYLYGQTYCKLYCSILAESFVKVENKCRKDVNKKNGRKLMPVFSYIFLLSQNK